MYQLFFYISMIVILTQRVFYCSNKILNIESQRHDKRTKKLYQFTTMLKNKESINYLSVKIFNQIKLRSIELQNKEKLAIQKAKENFKRKKQREELDILISLPDRSSAMLFKLIEDPNIPLDFQTRCDEFDTFVTTFDNKQLSEISEFVIEAKSMISDCSGKLASLSASRVLVLLIASIPGLGMNASTNNEDIAVQITGDEFKLLDEFIKKVEVVRQVSAILEKINRNLQDFNNRFLLLGNHLECWYNYREEIQENKETVYNKLVSLVVSYFSTYAKYGQKKTIDALKINENNFIKQKPLVKSTVMPSTIQMDYESENELISKCSQQFENNYLLGTNYYNENELPHNNTEIYYKTKLNDYYNHLETIAEIDGKEN